MKNLKFFALAAVLGMGVLTGCGSSSSSSSSSSSTSSEPQEEVATVIEVNGEFTEVPEDYPFIAAADFQTAFDNFYEKSNASDATSMTYDEIVEIFGAPGAYYADQDYNDGQYKYYKWFSDDDKDVLITFKGNGMTYFAWTSSTVSPGK